MPIIVGLTKMTYFAKLANLARIHQRSGKKFKWDNKRGLLAAGNFHKNGKNPSKVLQISNEVTKTEILTNGDYKKMANFGWKREISAKMASMPKSHRGVCQIFKYDNKTGILTNDDFTKITNLARIYRFGKN